MEHKPIDFSKWVTQKSLADELGVKLNVVCNWVKRGKIAAKKFPQLNDQVLVDKTTLVIKLKRIE